MILRPLSFLILCFSITLLCGCGEEPAPPAPSSPPQKMAIPKKKQVKPKVEVKKPKKEPVYVYNPAGRRDPFEALVLVNKTLVLSKKKLTPLEKFRVSQYRLLGIITGKGKPKAMVSAPDGKSYILTPGLRIGDKNGMIVKITVDGVFVEEQDYDLAGNARTKTEVITRPKREGAE